MEIRLANLTKVFPGNPKKNIVDTIAVNNLELTISSGKLIGLLGPSGCGKSTTLYMISGLLEPTGGEIWFGDEDVTRLAPEKRGIGLVFQNYALYPHMTVYKNISFPLENLKVEEQKVDSEGNAIVDPYGNPVIIYRKLTRDEIDRAVRETAALVQIEHYLERKPSQMSGGQQQRVAIARALVKRPKVLLLDEPLSNLDARLRLQTREEIKRLQRETKITTIFVTHDQEEAMSISDEIVVMKEGLIQQVGHPQHVYDNPHNLFVAKFLGTPPINIFNGQIKNNSLYVGDEKIMDITKHVRDQEVYFGVRPEGFIIDPKGPFGIEVEAVETMGRDFWIVGKHKESTTPTFKCIVDAGNEIKEGTLRVSLKPNKIFVFNKETEARIH